MNKKTELNDAAAPAAPAATDAPATERLPMPEPEGGWPADEFTGHGGSFVRDLYTGLRSRAVPDAS